MGNAGLWLAVSTIAANSSLVGSRQSVKPAYFKPLQKAPASFQVMAPRVDLPFLSHNKPVLRSNMVPSPRSSKRSAAAGSVRPPVADRITGVTRTRAAARNRVPKTAHGMRIPVVIIVAALLPEPCLSRSGRLPVCQKGQGIELGSIVLWLPFRPPIRVTI